MFLRRCSTIILLVGMLFSNSLLACASDALNPRVGIKLGVQGRYIGSFPYEEYAWMHFVVTGIEGTVLNVTLTYDLRSPFRSPDNWYWPDHPRYMLIDVDSGRNNLFLFCIPPNLAIGDRVPVPTGYPNMTIDGTISGTYAGKERAIVYAKYEDLPSGGDGTFYWDQKTGLLVELVADVAQVSASSMKLIETTAWSNTFMELLASNYGPAALLIIGFAAPGTILAIFMRKRMSKLYRVSHPRIGKFLIGMGVALFVIGILNLSLFNQVVSSLSFALALTFSVIGLLFHSGAWAFYDGAQFRVDLGVILISASVILIGIVGACSMYREIGAVVPYFSDIVRYQAMIPQEHLLRMEAVFVNPHAWIVTPLASVALPLALFGFALKLLPKTERKKPQRNSLNATVTHA